MRMCCPHMHTHTEKAERVLAFIFYKLPCQITVLGSIAHKMLYTLSMKKYCVHPVYYASFSHNNGPYVRDPMPPQKART